LHRSLPEREGTLYPEGDVKILGGAERVPSAAAPPLLGGGAAAPEDLWVRVVTRDLILLLPAWLSFEVAAELLLLAEHVIGDLEERILYFLRPGDLERMGPAQRASSREELHYLLEAEGRRRLELHPVDHLREALVRQLVASRLLPPDKSAYLVELIFGFESLEEAKAQHGLALQILPLL